MRVYHTIQLAAKTMIEWGTKVGSIVVIASVTRYMVIRSQKSSAYREINGEVRAVVPSIAAEVVKYVYGNFLPSF